MTRIIFQNILSNAIKFSKVGGRIELFSEEYDKSNILICIKDEGIGMDVETLSKIFKIDENITRKGTMNELGSGLGLIIIKELIDIQKGKVWIESEENKGTCFKIVLPKSN
jgi:signal transduction histidine kinase